MDELPQTERTKMDRISLEDASFFLELVNSPDWIRFIGDHHVSNIDEARAFLSNGFLRCYAENEYGYYVAKLKLDLAPIGIAGFLNKPELENPDFGFALLPRYYGKGLAFEFSQAILDYGLRTFGFRVLDAVTTPENVRSQRLLKKLAFQEEKHVSSNTGERLVLFRRRPTEETATAS